MAPQENQQADQPGGVESNGSDLSTCRLANAPTRLPQTFSPNEIVASRFRIARFIGSGGMGEVYEAEDRELGDRVALKTIRPEIASDERMISRFRSEIQLARRVTHPNVCRIFDLFRHQSSVNREAVTFLTMELLAGETLQERIRRSGRIPVTEALPLVRDMAAALGAAHDAGIVHRDFKSGNVIVVPSSTFDSRERAVITDFGLAKRISLEEIQGPEAVEGTPAYMAPEQADGGPITAAADIYALGVVMYEMVTGIRPFGDSSVSAVQRRAQLPPMPPRAHIPELTDAWNKTINRCLEHDAGKRPRSAYEVIRSIDGRSWMLRSRAAVILAGIALLLAVLLALRLRVVSPPTEKQRQTVTADGFQGRRSVAVLGFRNLSGNAQSQWLSTALAEMLTTELGAGEQLRMVPGENIGRMNVELALVEAESYTPATLSRIRANLNADIVVLGSFLHLGKENGNRIRIDVRLQDAGSGRTIASFVENGDEARLFDLVLRCGDSLRRRLGVAPVTESETKSFRASFPANQRALQLYSEAVQKVRRFESMAAKDLLSAAIKEDPDNALTRSTLASVLSLLGADKPATDEARRAFEQSAGLSREQQLLIEGRYRAMNRERDKAIAIFRALFSFFPDNVDYGLVLARAQYQAGKGKEALATIEELQKLPAPWSQDPQIPLTEAFAAMALADFPRELSASSRAVRAAAAVNAKLLVARARIPEAWALRNLGRPAEARKSLEEAYRIYTDAGDRHGVAQTLNPLAILHYDDRDLAGAGRLYQEALALYRQTGDRYATFMALSNIAGVQADLWKLDAARDSFQQALEVSLEADRKRATAAAHTGLAMVIRYRGDLDDSFRHYTQALNIAREAGDTSRIAEALFGQAQVLRLKGDLNRARLIHRQALKLRQETKQPAHEAGSRFAIAQLALDAERFAEGEREARSAAEAFARLKRSQSAAEAQILVAESMIGQRRNGEAAAMLPRIEEGLRERGDYSQLVRLDVLRARLLAGSGQSAEASKLLEATAARTVSGPLELHYDVQFHRGVIERRRGREAEARATLLALSSEARKKGFHFFARKADTALHPLPR